MPHNRSIRQRFPFAGLVMLFLAAPVFGSTIVSVTYNLGQDEFEGGDSQIWGAESWMQTGSYTDVTIRATLLREVLNNPPGDGTAFLEEKVGNHAVQIASDDFVFPKDEAEIKLFTGLSLGPGTYYLSVFGPGFLALRLCRGDANHHHRVRRLQRDAWLGVPRRGTHFRRRQLRSL